jgi:hypothetical protein
MAKIYGSTAQLKTEARNGREEKSRTAAGSTAPSEHSAPVMLSGTGLHTCFHGPVCAAGFEKNQTSVLLRLQRKRTLRHLPGIQKEGNPGQEKNG